MVMVKKSQILREVLEKLETGKCHYFDRGVGREFKYYRFGVKCRQNSRIY